MPAKLETFWSKDSLLKNTRAGKLSAKREGSGKKETGSGQEATFVAKS